MLVHRDLKQKNKPTTKQRDANLIEAFRFYINGSPALYGETPGSVGVPRPPAPLTVIVYHRHRSQACTEFHRPFNLSYLPVSLNKKDLLFTFPLVA